VKDVQLENGYTAIAHTILEKMARIKLSPTQYRLIFVIWRYTYGFKRKSHNLTLSFLSNATGCDERQIQRELKRLEKRKVIFQQINSKQRKISFNKKYNQWVGEIDIGETVNLKDFDIGEIDNGGIDIGEIDNGGIGNWSNRQNDIGEIVNPDIGEIDNQENYIFKTNIKTNIAAAIENPVEQIGNLFFELTGRFANGNDFVAISETLKKYSDLEVITKVMKRVTEKKRKKDPSDKIKSFSFFTGAIEDEFKKIEAKKAGENIGRAERDNEEDYDYSNLMYKGTVTYNDDDIDF
jgi:phage replication O-like protein O